MFYSRWAKDSEIKDATLKLDYRGEVTRSGLPLIYEGNSLYAVRRDGHSLVIGATGSGKTQSVVLPLVKLAMLAKESVIINDPKGDIYKRTAKEFKNRGYNVITLDFDNAIYGNYYNPLNLAYKLYKEGNSDKCVNVIEEIAYYLFTDLKDESDSFWKNAASDYFTGLCLYLFEKEESEVNFNDIYNLATKLNNKSEYEKFMNGLDKNSLVYYNVSGTLTAPDDTKGGIFSVFGQKIKRFIGKENLSNMMSKTDFNIDSIGNTETIVYIVSGYYDYSNSLIPLFINQVFEAINIYGNSGRKVNIILDEFDNLLPIKNFQEIINYARGIGINFTCVIKSFINLINTYGKENVEIVKLCFTNIVYLYANDLRTLEEVSSLCGFASEGKPLINPEELKMLEQFEAVVLMPRIMPYKAKLVPDYMINWHIDFEETDFELRK